MINFIVISAPSGSGKTTLCRALQEQIPNLKFSVSWTTRPARDYEKNGYDYNFIDKEEFDKLLLNKEFAEHEVVHGFNYGTPKNLLEEIKNNNKLLILELDVNGAVGIKSLYPDETILIFIMPPSIMELKERLRKRGSDSEVRIKKRLERLEMELSYKDKFDYEIINADLSKALEELTKLISQETKGVINVN
jgi:guanylate kinase